MTPTRLGAILTGFVAASFAQLAIGQTPVPVPGSEQHRAAIAEATAAAEAGGSGTYRANMLVETGLPTHTIYRPEDLDEATRNAPLPIVVWGNGACVNYGNRFRYFLTEIASHGYFVAAIGPIGPSWLEWSLQTPGDPDVRPEDREPTSFASQLTDAIDWAIAENAKDGSPYENRLDADRIAVMGMSCGGLQAISAAADPRVDTLMVWNSGTFPKGVKALPGTGGATKSSLSELHAATAYISGDESDIAFENANADFEELSGIPVFRAWKRGVGHSGTYREPRGGAFLPVAVAWLDWQLKGESSGGAMFAGEDCTLCTDSQWHVRKKAMP